MADKVLHRNPILNAPLVDAVDVIMLDTLHTVYLGVINRYTAEVLWRALDGNPWGTAPATFESNLRNLKADLMTFYEATGVPLDHRIGDLTAGMMGRRRTPAIKTKAVETACVFPFAMELCRRHADHIQSADALHAAGEALRDYLGLLRSSPAQVPLATCQRLLDLCIRHLVLIGVAGVPFAPNHHIWCHLTVRTRAFGNPRCYSTCFDESLSRVLANIAQRAHRAQWELRTFARVHVLPHVKEDCWFVLG